MGVGVFCHGCVPPHGCGNPRHPSLPSRHPLTHSNRSVRSASELKQPEQASAAPGPVCEEDGEGVCGTGVTQSAQGGQRLTTGFFTDQAFLFFLSSRFLY